MLKKKREKKKKEIGNKLKLYQTEIYFGRIDFILVTVIYGDVNSVIKCFLYSDLLKHQ